VLSGTVVAVIWLEYASRHARIVYSYLAVHRHLIHGSLSPRGFSPSTASQLVQLFLPARRCASTGTSHGPVSVCPCLSQVGVLSKRLNEASWFLARELLSTRPMLLTANLARSKNKGTSFWNSVPNSGTLEILLRYLDRRNGST